ncbi:response regulator transcription factor [Natranaerobius thermophilus]|uniref:Stage 0 sporulation protein A homolog n=1 Tax=Natranaerobius thermophilus (strain ATCC BAA-1301 / DSM 18059 / JW/NM-WN-LF) TaxID=457570 RepID=B2A0K7_NATTJ|nr:response regulator transcription factor [Natranaerobius thermophilus]ACB84568.1 two component transcriptional regulator, winged helix family [Natranaerobius thermophilus JW/NM-WN-LF]
MHRILLVEDEHHIAKLVNHNLIKEGYEVEHVTHGDEAFNKYFENDYDLIILDLMLPGLDGLEVCRKIRGNSSLHIPVIMLTAKSDEIEKIVGLEMGADDYVTKPFSPRELLARVKAQLRGRTKELTDEKSQDNSNKIFDQRDKSEDVKKNGPLSIKPEKYRAYIENQELQLTPKEFELLNIMVTNSGQVLTREKLLEKIWGYDFLGDTRTVDVHIRHLRQKISEAGGPPDLVETVRGIGYRLKEME